MLCLECKKPFDKSHGNTKYCCEECRIKRQKRLKQDYWYNRGGKIRRDRAVQKRRETNPELNSKLARKHSLKTRYNMTIKEYDQMFEAQNGVCAICGTIEFSGRRLAVDHNHETNHIRGLLCINCNRKLSVLEDRNFIKQAEQYLKATDK